MGVKDQIISDGEWVWESDTKRLLGQLRREFPCNDFEKWLSEKESPFFGIDPDKIKIGNKTKQKSSNDKDQDKIDILNAQDAYAWLEITSLLIRHALMDLSLSKGINIPQVFINRLNDPDLRFRPQFSFKGDSIQFGYEKNRGMFHKRLHPFF